MWPPTFSPDFINLEFGLEIRGFTGISGIDSMSYCNKNEKHYILRTDGLIIYSNFPWTHTGQEWLTPKDCRQTWDMSDFSFKELDEVMMIEDLAAT